MQKTSQREEKVCLKFGSALLGVKPTGRELEKKKEEKSYTSRSMFTAILGCFKFPRLEEGVVSS